MSLKRLAALLSALVLLISCASGEGLVTFGGDAADYVEDPFALPIDFSGGRPLDRSGLIAGTAYEDPTIRVTLESGRHMDCNWWAARIKIASPTQLRTVSAGGFDTGMTMLGTALAKRVNAVLAIDGDYYFYTGKGFILRQGTVYRNLLDGTVDVLLIDEFGDFRVVRNAMPESCSNYMDGRRIINAMYFGPALVLDGQAVSNVSGSNMAYDLGRQRMCIAQVGPLEYMCICCAGPARGSEGMTLQVFADFVATFGVQTAYNLDGGDSTMLIFDGEKINDVNNSSSRKISDIIYFASAWGQ